MPASPVATTAVKRKKKNVAMPDVFATAAKYTRDVFGASAKNIGSGLQAEVFVVKNDAVLKQCFKKLQHRTGALPRRRYVCLKIRALDIIDRPANPLNHMSWARNRAREIGVMSSKEILKEWRDVVSGGRHEYATLEYMYRPPDAPKACWFRPQDFVPQPYFQGVDMEKGVHILAMEYKRSRPLSRHLSKPMRSPDLAANVEKAVLTMWYAGVVHTDLHTENMLADSNTQTVTIIDLGYAKVLPAAVRAQLRQRIDPVVNALRNGIDMDVHAFGNDVWKELLRPLFAHASATGNHGIVHVAHTYFKQKYYAARGRDVRRSRLLAARKKAWACVRRPRPI
jgi:serine/threonine protein kinase